MRHLVAALLALTLSATAGLAAPDEGRTGWFELPVPGGLTTLEAFGIAAAERAFTVSLLARALQDNDLSPGLAPEEFRAALAAGASADTPAVTVPAPLSPAAWDELLPPSTAPLFERLVSDRSALLLAAALSATHGSVRSLLEADRDLLRFIYERAPGAFAVVARRLEVVDGAMAVPGGGAAEAIWEALAGESPARPVAFLRQLLTRDDGRLAWYYDTIGGFDPERLAVAWRDGTRAEARELYESFRQSDPQWRLNARPYRRTVADAWTVVTQIQVANGAVVSPLSQQVWNDLFAKPRLARGQALAVLRQPPTDVSMAWLTRQIVLAERTERPVRFQLFRLAQRVFASAPPAALPDIVVALSAMREHPALPLTLERMNVTRPDTWALAAAAARHVSTVAQPARESLMAFQAALALVERLRHVRTLDAGAADGLVRELSEAVLRDRRVTRSVAAWVHESLTARLPRLRRPDAWTGATAYESVILQGLAGPAADGHHQTLDWEGLSYVVDVTAAEHERLRRMRALLPSRGLDVAMGSGDPRALAGALVSLVYATALGEPDGPASLGPGVVQRHQFGFTAPGMLRDTLPWATPAERQGVGSWHVQGSILGLDLALSRLQLRRLTDQQMPQAPTVTLTDLATLTRTTVLLVPADLQDAERDELAAAIDRGRQRVSRAVTAEALAPLLREAALSATVAQVVPWLLARQPEAISELFSLRDLLWLGRPRLSRAALDRWGVSGEGLDGRRVVMLPPPAPWEDYTGRSEVGQVTTQVPDLTLRIVEETARWQLPAQLIPALLGFATTDYWHNVQVRFADDWPQLTREAARLSATRIEDYVAALTANGPLRATPQ